MNRESGLVVVSGPSGCGKDTVVRRLRQIRPSVRLSVSCTTRKPRCGEIDGVDYHFITPEEFERKIAQGEMLEYTLYDGRYYGTPRSEIEPVERGETVVLIIEVTGARQVKKIFPGSLCVFIVPPSLEALEERLRKRSTESEEEIRRRLAIAAVELQVLKFYDCAIENGVADDCANKLLETIDRWQEKADHSNGVSQNI